ncbi:hypothetical protein HUK80_06485 [Flavobacterium sp. MAH-1]|uniref:Uncharacterized protein n=1 Tax=Flavobacterium agri TaxID=2743471 RepID=A0A7Y9C538_9FLAO|nr:hypothetical protein [Flavobacterium agri]NUY80536.1 hypothetical protein [Flavobacterium agri]NYA70560.1 hypothetical protein [Flavobacterium agri]
MTAVVGILNKQAIAIAADSAVTVTTNTGKKIFNKANKIFTLSKYHPVGIIIYNSASLMGIPWETIIKVYRNNLKKKSFGSLEEYQKDFLKFLKTKNYFLNNEIQKIHTHHFLVNFSMAIIQKPEKKEQPGTSIATRLKSAMSIIERILSTAGQIEGLAGFTYEQFDSYTKDAFDEIRKSVLSDPSITDEIFTQYKKFMFMLINKQEDGIDHTGLIFCGFGDNEIFPSMIPMNISMVIDNKLRCYIIDKKRATIGHMVNAAIRPFAQTDVIDTILQGIDPNLEKILVSNFEKTLQKYGEAIATALGGNTPMAMMVRNVSIVKLGEEFRNLNSAIKQKHHVTPLINAVANLAKEDLSEMAESLIYLTYLKRRITFAEESVGGPVDVAIISKGDGFVWMKRKHYFDAEINQSFLKKYFE